MRQYLRCLAAGSLLLALSASHPASAQKRGGILRLASPASPANMSIHEAATIVAEMPMMGVFNNLIVFDQHRPQDSSFAALLVRQLAWPIQIAPVARGGAPRGMAHYSPICASMGGQWSFHGAAAS